MFCTNCGSEVSDKAIVCIKCGVGLHGTVGKREKTTAGVLAILLGSVGAHKFYHGNWGLGILYVLFCWTGAPTILGIAEGIIYLTMDSGKYNDKYNRSR